MSNTYRIVVIVVQERGTNEQRCCAVVKNLEPGWCIHESKIKDMLRVNCELSSQTRNNNPVEIPVRCWELLVEGTMASFAAKWSKLNWRSPSTLLPHGWSGILSLLSGVYLLGSSQFQSSLAVYGTSAPYHYVLFTMVNAVAGYRISSKAPSKTRSIFKACAVFQCLSCYYVLRFLPSFHTKVPSKMLRTLDCAMVLPFLGVGVSFLHAAYVVHKQSPASAVAITVGTLASATTFSYPMHLVYDANWLTCILEQRYAEEDITLVAYVYVPATMCFSFMIFGATLLQRGLIPDVYLGCLAVVCFTCTVILSLLLQEVQLPVISGLQIYMPCPAPQEGSLSHRLEKLTDPRDSFQRLLTYPWVKAAIAFIGAVPITDHDSYRV
jgi:hypothetical protein